MGDRAKLGSVDDEWWHGCIATRQRSDRTGLDWTCSSTGSVSSMPWSRGRSRACVWTPIMSVVMNTQWQRGKLISLVADSRHRTTATHRSMLSNIFTLMKRCSLSLSLSLWNRGGKNQWFFKLKICFFLFFFGFLWFFMVFWFFRFKSRKSKIA